MDFIKSTCYIFLLFIFPQILTKTIKSTESRCAPNVPHRCFPDEPCWPSEEEWKSLNESVHGRLSIPHLSIEACLGNDATFINGEDSCQRSLERLGEDPFYFQQFPGGVESTGQAGGWTALPSSHAVEVQDESDIVNAVKFAKNFNLRLVVKGTGHDYYGRSSAPNSLLIWTHHLRDMEFHNNFIPAGMEGNEGIPAVTLGAGLTWMDVYAAASVDRGLYVQGGGCTSVGVIGWHIGGGYGSFSKMFGTGPANMLEARIVTANGDIVVVSEYQNEDLFFALRGGGHGFGVIISLTVRTHPLPEYFGTVNGQITPHDLDAGKELLTTFLDFYKNNLLGPNWGEQVEISNSGLGISMLSVGLTENEMKEVWAPMIEFLNQRPNDYTYEWEAVSIPGRVFWDANFLVPAGWVIPTPYDPSEPDRAFFWSINQGEIAKYWLAYVSRFLRVDQFLDDTQLGMQKLIDLLFGVGSFSLHLNKAQYGASSWAVKELEKTAMHPSVKDSFGLLIMGLGVSHYSPLVPNHLQYNTSEILAWQEACHTENLDECEILQEFYKATRKFREDTPGAGAYFNEADFFEYNWQESFWGMENYARLLEIKNKWDSEKLFYCHNCVGAEFWEEGGMCQKLEY